MSNAIASLNKDKVTRFKTGNGGSDNKNESETIKDEKYRCKIFTGDQVLKEAAGI